MDIVSAIIGGVVGSIITFAGTYFLKSHFFEKSKHENDIRNLREANEKLKEEITNREDKLRRELKEEINRMDDKIMAAMGWKKQK